MAQHIAVNTHNYNYFHVVCCLIKLTKQINFCTQQTKRTSRNTTVFAYREKNLLLYGFWYRENIFHLFLCEEKKPICLNRERKANAIALSEECIMLNKNYIITHNELTFCHFVLFCLFIYLFLIENVIVVVAAATDAVADAFHLINAIIFEHFIKDFLMTS